MASLHPVQTHWFEIVVPRAQTVYALEILASSGDVELEHDALSKLTYDTRALRETVSAAERLLIHHKALLPSVHAPTHLLTTEPNLTATSAFAEIRHWLAEQLRLERRLSLQKRAAENLALLRECFDAMSEAGDALVELDQTDELLSKRIYACPRGESVTVLADAATVVEVFRGSSFDFHVVLCLPEQSAVRERICQQHHCQPVKVPPWLGKEWDHRYLSVDQRLQALGAQIDEIEQALATRRSDKTLLDALADVAILRWFLDHAMTLSEDRRHCIVSGWTTVERPEVLQHRLQQGDVEAHIVMRPALPAHPSPVDLSKGRLSRLFRPFVRFAGTPGATEVDPSALLAMLVPVLFGMMFPDVGHGLVLVIVGLVFARRYPRARLLVPCGLAAAFFGGLFGEVFGSHTLIPALWFCPLDQPLWMLAVSLVLGVCVLLTALVLSGVEAYWKEELRHWLLLDAAVLVLYLALVVGLLYRPALLISALAFAWYLIGATVTSRHGRWHALVDGVGRFLFSSFELVVNTLSFLRVGAFGLAHSALTHTLLELTEGIESAVLKLAMLLIGHAFIIAIETLVVFVQTTRLIVFEFFSRFLRAEGRLMRPLRSPESQ